MFTNSLFSDYLKEYGLKVDRNESTKDIICLVYSFGTHSYEDEKARLESSGRDLRLPYKIAKSKGDIAETERIQKKRKRIADLYLKARDNKDLYVRYSKETVRNMTYNQGVEIEYISYKHSGEIAKRETVHYQMLYRSTGKAKFGYCMFICDRLYKRARKFLYMGIKMPKNNAPIVEASAYVPLISSTIVDRIEIDPKRILILKDVERFFSTNVVSIEVDENRRCYTKHISDYKLKNTLFDGQALIDSSIFPPWGNGYILLRHHFCKMAAFCTEIQKFFRDYFGADYETATVTDMFGESHFVKDILVITTDSGMKWVKFGKTYDYWCDRVRENGCKFGIVKTAHESKLGAVQRMSYQMVNSLDESIMPNVVKESVDFVESLKKDDTKFLEYLEHNAGYANDYEVLVALCKQDPEFTRCTYFRERKQEIIGAYVQKLKNGKILQNAENLVVVGSPYAMLLYGATGDPDSVDGDITFYQEPGTIQCYTERFNSGEYLAFFRSPFNAKNNLMYLHNTYHSAFEKYFHLGRQTIAINMIGTDAQDRSNGMDMDSDFGYTTNQPDIVEHARKCYRDYPTIVNNIPKEKAAYSNTMSDYAKMDNALAASQRNIGESSNLAQIAQTYACNLSDPKYDDYVCILSVVAQAAIDNAKRTFDIDISGEIKRIRNDMEISKYGFPAFWSGIRPGFSKARINPALHSPMNYLAGLKFSRAKAGTPAKPVSDFFVKYDAGTCLRTCKKMEDFIQTYAWEYYLMDFTEETMESKEAIAMDAKFQDMVADLERMKVSKYYLGFYSWLIDRAFLITPRVITKHSKMLSYTSKNKSLLLKALYKANPQNLLKCFSKNIKK